MENIKTDINYKIITSIYCQDGNSFGKNTCNESIKLSTKQILQIIIALDTIMGQIHICGFHQSNTYKKLKWNKAMNELFLFITKPI